MSIFDQIRSALRPKPSAEEIAMALLRLRGGKAAEIIPAWKENKPVEAETKFDALVRNGWRKNELIFACSSRKASTASQVDLDVVRKRDQVELDDHPLTRVLENPNPFMSQFDFIASISIFQDFAGVAYYEKVRSRAGQVVQLWPLRPDWVKPLQSKVNFVSGYSYGPPGLDPVILPPQDVLSLPLWDPLNMYRGYPPVAVAARVADLDNAVTDYMRLLFQEGGVPPGLLKTKQAIDQAIADKMRDEWRSHYGGYKNWVDPAVLGYDLEYQKSGLSIQEMGLEILDERSEVRICMVLKVPPTVIATMVGLKRAIMSNAELFEYAWWVNDLIPMYKSWGDNFRTQLASEFGDDLEIKWDFQEVPALSPMFEKPRQAALEAFRAGAITRNQYNELVSLPTLGPAGDVYLISASMVEVPAGSLVPKKPKTPAEPAKSQKSLDNSVPANAPDDEARRQSEASMTDDLTAFFEGEFGRIKAGLTKFHGNRPVKEAHEAPAQG